MNDEGERNRKLFLVCVLLLISPVSIVVAQDDSATIDRLLSEPYTISVFDWKLLNLQQEIDNHSFGERNWFHSDLSFNRELYVFYIDFFHIEMEANRNRYPGDLHYRDIDHLGIHSIIDALCSSLKEHFPELQSPEDLITIRFLLETDSRTVFLGIYKNGSFEESTL